MEANQVSLLVLLFFLTVLFGMCLYSPVDANASSPSTLAGTSSARFHSSPFGVNGGGDSWRRAARFC